MSHTHADIENKVKYMAPAEPYVPDVDFTANISTIGDEGHVHMELHCPEGWLSGICAPRDAFLMASAPKLARDLRAEKAMVNALAEIVKLLFEAVDGKAGLKSTKVDEIRTSLYALGVYQRPEPAEVSNVEAQPDAVEPKKN